MFCIVRLKIVLFKRVCVLVFLQNAGSQLCFGFFFKNFHGETCHHSQARVLIDCSWHTSLLNSRALRVNQNQAERIYRSSHFALLYFALLFNYSLTNRHRPQHHSSRENYDIWCGSTDQSSYYAVLITAEGAGVCTLYFPVGRSLGIHPLFFSVCLWTPASFLVGLW